LILSPSDTFTFAPYGTLKSSNTLFFASTIDNFPLLDKHLTTLNPSSSIVSANSYSELNLTEPLFLDFLSDSSAIRVAVPPIWKVLKVS
jgi:hypothetical protein